MSLISGVALVTLVGLIKSFRLRQILLEADSLRGGVLFDCFRYSMPFFRQ
jgi:hypothetical protein